MSESKITISCPTSTSPYRSPPVLPPISYFIVVPTALAGMAGTIWWWQAADRRRVYSLSSVTA